jgi:hypothetical protein
MRLQNYAKTGNIKLGAFTATGQSRKSLACRMAGPIVVPDDMTFNDYIRKAFQTEFELANVLSENSKVTLTGNLNKVELNSVSGHWIFDMTFYANGNELFTINADKEFETFFRGDEACKNSAAHFAGAIQLLVEKTCEHPKFMAMFSEKKK